jgi:hypothetical protein
MGYIRPCYPCSTIFFALDPIGNLVFSSFACTYDFLVRVGQRLSSPFVQSFSHARYRFSLRSSARSTSRFSARVFHCEGWPPCLVFDPTGPRARIEFPAVASCSSASMSLTSLQLECAAQDPFSSAFHHRFSSLRAAAVPELCLPSPKTWFSHCYFFIIAALVSAATFCQSCFSSGVNF